MKRYATLALAAIFALSFTANVAAAPEFSGEFTIENELALGGDAINVGGDGPDLTFTLGAGEEGIWSLEVDLGSALADGPTTGYYVDAVGAYVAEKAEGASNATYYKDIDGKWYKDGVVGALDDAGKAAAHRDIALKGDGWIAYAPTPDADDRADKTTANDIELGAYKLTVTPGPFTLVVAGNEKALQTKDRFEFIKSTKEPVDPKFQLTTDIAGIGLTAEYETEGDDALFAFAKAPVAGVGEFGVALEVKDIAKEEAATQFSVDVASDALGFATLKAGVAFDMAAEEGKDALAFAVGAEAPVIEGLVVDASYKNDGRDKEEKKHVQTISAGVKYNEDMVTASVAYRTDDADGEPRLTLKGAVNYPVIADVFTVKASVESITDEDSPITSDPTAYEWDGIDVGDILYGLLTIDASADYAVTDAFTITPSLKYQSFTFQNEAEGSITTFGAEGTYKFSDSASVTVGLEKASGEGVEDVVPEVDSTKLTTAFTVSF